MLQPLLLLELLLLLARLVVQADVRASVVVCRGQHGRLRVQPSAAWLWGV